MEEVQISSGDLDEGDKATAWPPSKITYATSTFSILQMLALQKLSLFNDLTKSIKSLTKAFKVVVFERLKVPPGKRRKVFAFKNIGPDA